MADVDETVDLTDSLESKDSLDDEWVIKILDNRKELGLLLIPPNGGRIKCFIENSPLCCEEWGFDFDCSDIHEEQPEITGELISIEHSHAREIASQGEYDTGHDRRKSYVCVILTTSDDIYDISMWCSHNGYYSHTTTLDWDCSAGKYHDETRL
jgi:hypothetical protein